MAAVTKNVLAPDNTVEVIRAKTKNDVNMIEIRLSNKYNVQLQLVRCRGVLCSPDSRSDS